MSARQLLRRPPAALAAVLVLVLLALVAACSHGGLHGSLLTAAGSRWLQAHNREHPHHPRATGAGHQPSPPGHVGAPGSAGADIPSWLGIAALVVLALVLVAWLVRRWQGARRSAGLSLAAESEIEPTGEGSREALRVAVDRSLAELRSDPNARRAIIGAYRLMEVALQRAGLPRGPAEAPREFLARALGSLDVGPRAPQRLTALFERARFDRAALDLSARDDAIEALTALRARL